MPRPRNKDDLIKAANEQYKKLNDFIVSMTKQELDTEFDFRKKMFEKSHADVLGLADRYTNEQLFGRGVFPWVSTKLSLL